MAKMNFGKEYEYGLNSARSRSALRIFSNLLLQKRRRFARTINMRK